jgi:cardiolipin synthase
LDGYIARKFNQITSLGKILDPIADKALLVSAFIFIYNSNLEIKFPFWLVVIVISRDIYLVIGSALIYFFKGHVKIKPSVFGKATTFFQILTVVFVLIANIFFISAVYLDYLFYITSFFIIISAIDYTYKGLAQILE